MSTHYKLAKKSAYMKTLKYPRPNKTHSNSLMLGSLGCPALLMALFASAFSGQAANILANPGFETGDPTGWVKYGVFDFNTTNNFYYNNNNPTTHVWIFDGRFS